jgi:hypothetical protein
MKRSGRLILKRVFKKWGGEDIDWNVLVQDRYR